MKGREQFASILPSFGKNFRIFKNSDTQVIFDHEGACLFQLYNETFDSIGVICEDSNDRQIIWVSNKYWYELV